MEWIHKKVTITIGGDGKFHFTVNGAEYKRKSLEEAKSCIDSLLKDYYSVDVPFVETLLRKLKKREQDFVKSLIQEVYIHEDNAYCEIGISDKFEFDCRFDKLVEELC